MIRPLIRSASWSNVQYFPGDGGHRNRQMRVHPHPHRPQCLLLRVAPAVPGSLDGLVDELDPVGVLAIAGGWRKGQHLPPPVLADDREHRLTARPSKVAKGSRVARVRGHQPLLHGEDQLVSGVESRRWERRIAPAEADLERADGLA